MTDVAAIKDKVDIVDILELAGARIDYAQGSEWTVFCPFHVNVNTPAAHVNVMKQVFNCFSCGARGDVISVTRLYLEMEGKPHGFRDAVQFLESFA